MPNIPTVSWDETEPTGDRPKSQGDDRIRELKGQIREVVDVDHKFDSSGQGATWGHHDAVHLIVQGSDPTTVTNEVIVYSKDPGDTNEELFIKDSLGNVMQVTEGGSLNVLQYYSTGTVTVTNDSTTVEGAGGMSFTTCAAGDVFWIDGATRYYSIASITDADTLVLTEKYGGVTAAGASYHIGKVANYKQFLPRVGASSRIAMGTYTGNGVDARNITGVGFDLTNGTWTITLLRLKVGADTGIVCLKTSSMGTNSLLVKSGYYGVGLISAGTSDGFTVSDNASVNESGTTYNYIVTKLT